MDDFCRYTNRRTALKVCQNTKLGHYSITAEDTNKGEKVVKWSMHMHLRGVGPTEISKIWRSNSHEHTPICDPAISMYMQCQHTSYTVQFVVCLHPVCAYQFHHIRTSNMSCNHTLTQLLSSCRHAWQHIIRMIMTGVYHTHMRRMYCVYIPSFLLCP